MIKAQQNSGYPGLEGVPNEAKPLQEISDCMDFATELRARHGVPLRDITENSEKALPDCLGRMDRQRVGIEVTRLTITPQERDQYVDCLIANIGAYCLSKEKDDAEKVKDIRAALAARPLKLARAIEHISPADQIGIHPSPPDWPFEYFQERLQAAISQKEKKALWKAEEGKLGEFAKLFLLVRTNEHPLSERLVEEHLQQVEIASLCHFDAAYLKLPYQPIDGRHPVFRIPAS